MRRADAATAVIAPGLRVDCRKQTAAGPVSLIAEPEAAMVGAGLSPFWICRTNIRHVQLGACAYISVERNGGGFA